MDSILVDRDHEYAEMVYTASVYKHLDPGVIT